MAELQLTSTEEAVLLGTLLGDGHIQKRSNSFRSKISHRAQDKQYVVWKYEKLKRLCSKNHPPKQVTSKLNDESYFFYLNSGDYLKKYHQLFYQPTVWVSVDQTTGKRVEKLKYKKVITQALIDYLPKDPLMLAVWFLDDGNRRTDCFSGRLATQGFSKTEQQLLSKYLSEIFQIDTKIVPHLKTKQQYYLTIPAKNRQFSKFVSLIEPSVNQIDCMKYKIVDPRND